jgi:4-hydroxyphenylpyruvate dioxygenase-like putative hemolysin
MSDSLGAGDLWDNPMGTDGFEFVEYTGPDPKQLGILFERLGFVAAARHRSKNVTLLQAGRRQLHRQRRAGKLCPGVCPVARAVGLRDRLPGQGCRGGL